MVKDLLIYKYKPKNLDSFELFHVAEIMAFNIMGLIGSVKGNNALKKEMVSNKVSKMFFFGYAKALNDVDKIKYKDKIKEVLVKAEVEDSLLVNKALVMYKNEN